MKNNRAKAVFAKFIAVFMILTVVFTSGSLVFAEEESERDGSFISETTSDTESAQHFDYDYINAFNPSDKELNDEIQRRPVLRSSKRETFEEAYRSDRQPWGTDVKIKNQKNTGLCWAFVLTTAAEYSYGKEMYEATGRTDLLKELSPGHLGYFHFHHVNDPLGNTEGDRNLLWDTSSSWQKIGGDYLEGIQSLGNWIGAGLEEDTPFSRVNDDPPYGDEYAYRNYITLEESVMLSTSAGERETNIASLKKMIKQYGAVASSLQMDQKNFFHNNSYYNFTGVNQENHAITVIGWDDNYPKEEFTHTKNTKNDTLKNPNSGASISEEEAAGLTTPAGDGAWVVQNSWGDSYDNGVFYVSYYSCDISVKSRAFAFDMQPAETYQYNFQYDGTSDCGDVSDSGNEAFLTKEGTKAANVFENTTGEPITLDAVGYTLFSSNPTAFTIDVYTDLSDPKDPESGFFAGSTDVTTTSIGVKTAVLEKPVFVDAGEKYAIVFRFTDTLVKLGVEKERVDYQVQVDPGQSFFFGDGSESWTDMYEYNACFRIKGLANVVSDPSAMQYTVAFYDGFGNLIDTQKVPYGTDAIAPEPPQVKGYQFTGWDKEYSAVTGNLRVTATWKKLLSAGTAKAAVSAQTYNGSYLKPVPKVTWNGNQLEAGVDFKVSWNSNKNAGTASMTVTGLGEYAGSFVKSFTIKKAANSFSKVTTAKTLKYKTLKNHKQSFAIKATVKGKAIKTYQWYSVPKKAQKYLQLTSSGNLTVKKGLPKGTYTIKVKITAKETANYKSTSTVKKLKLTVK